MSTAQAQNIGKPKMTGRPRGRKRKYPLPVVPKLYTKEGINIETGVDQCDCLVSNCPGCFFNCPKCKSTKCGPVCRNNRTFCYTEMVLEQEDSAMDPHKWT